MRFRNSIAVALRLWWYTSLFIALMGFVFILFNEPELWWGPILLVPIIAVAGVPALILIFFLVYLLQGKVVQPTYKLMLILVSCVVICFVYATGFTIIDRNVNLFEEKELHWLQNSLLYTAFLSAAALTAFVLCRNRLIRIFSSSEQIFKEHQQHTMETTSTQDSNTASSGSRNTVLIKAFITGCLILALFIPTLLISSLVVERKKRNESVVTEVSNMWSGPQTLAGPFIYLPYKKTFIDEKGKNVQRDEHLWLLPEDLNMDGTVEHIIRQKSIYKVMLYRTRIQVSGNIHFRLPREVASANVNWADAKICFGLSDFKGIEEKMIINTPQGIFELSPGLPAADLVPLGLSTPFPVTENDLGRSISFALPLKLKGSEKFNFVPLGGNSSFKLSSAWHSPSFEGSTLPVERTVNDSGFTARWSFNKANLPFGTIISQSGFEPDNLTFGVSLLQPTDQYVKTDRSMKYAILLISLTFALFFVIELLQNKPMHPVQYTLIGLALLIFYTLLLSVSELIEFDLAYSIAAIATIGLITWYSGMHFRKWSSAIMLLLALTTLYGFIFVLIRLEDTALLFGSIGLFIILAAAMYFSRKINWYGNK